jgi:glyoxylase-like metal-dependent hydrolase (beta-lactamase superfamily II)
MLALRHSGTLRTSTPGTFGTRHLSHPYAMHFLDLHFLGLRHVVGTAVLRGPSGLTLIDPGPTSCLPALESGLHDHDLRLEDVQTVLLTHIHLDHAGAAGTLLARLPRAVLYVHERGAPHMANPAKLLASATRLYGANMDRYWGEFRPVPTDRTKVLTGGETLDVAGRTLEVAYTPGHASHHVSYLDLGTGQAFVGDTAGIRVAKGYIKVPTPPPDIDLELWEKSLTIFENWRPSSLVLTHFGVVDDPAEHVRLFRGVLARQAEFVRATLACDGTDDERISQFTAEMRADARRVLSEEEAKATEAAAAFDQLWLGLARYWRKKVS